MNFNDEIVSIEILNEEEMIDIEVSDDHLFYGDGILVSNSIGIPAVADFMLAATRNDEMDAVGQICFKQLKNRFRNMIYRPKFILGCEFDQQLFFDLAEREQISVEPIVPINSKDLQEKFKTSFHQRSRKKLSGIDLGELQ